MITERASRYMFTITIVPLSATALMSSAAKDTIQNANRLFLQTVQHPWSRFVLDSNRAFTSMDDLYESSDDFDALNQRIAARLVTAGECVYAVTGNIESSQLPAITKAATKAGGQVKVLPGIPAAFSAFPGLQIDATFSAAQLPTHLDPNYHLAITEIDHNIVASQVKLLLSEYFPDEWEVLLANIDEDGNYQNSPIPLFELDRQPHYDAATAVYIPAASIEQRVRYGYADLCNVLARLRAPGGCPWDREQTHQTLKAPLMEECYELMDAIDSGDDANMVEELGDVLMQVAFHACVGDEQGRFNDRDISTGVVRKLIYRHPHVFSDVSVHSSDEVLANWDKLKMTEKHQQSQTEVLMSVPRNFPALTRASKVQAKAASVGFDWPDAAAALPKVAEETRELIDAMNGNGDLNEEMGDLLFAVVNVSRLLGLDAELLLREATDKFISRFSAMEDLATANGKSLDGLSLNELDKLWVEVKKSRKL